MEIEARGTWQEFGDADLSAEIKGTEVVSVKIVTDKGGAGGSALHGTFDASVDGPSAPAVASGNTYTVTGKAVESSTGPAVDYTITFNCGS